MHYDAYIRRINKTVKVVAYSYTVKEFHEIQIKPHPLFTFFQIMWSDLILAKGIIGTAMIILNSYLHVITYTMPVWVRWIK